MASSEDVKKLAGLARLEVSEGEVEKFAKEFDAILAYVGNIETLVVAGAKNTHPPVRNVMRKDEHPHENGVHTKKLVAQFPEKDGDYLRVKQIISHD